MCLHTNENSLCFIMCHENSLRNLDLGYFWYSSSVVAFILFFFLKRKLQTKQSFREKKKNLKGSVFFMYSLIKVGYTTSGNTERARSGIGLTILPPLLNYTFVVGLFIPELLVPTGLNILLRTDNLDG